jgi:DNA-binding CsgD family transcriptional regulator
VASVVTGSQLSRGSRDGELRGLNEAERRVLLLLAEGHTAKSIASELDTTAAAVNERLREARRKTGVGSSRELARLLKAQENRHEQMGVGRQSALASHLRSEGGGLVRPNWKGPIVMIVALITILGVATLGFQQANSPSDIVANSAKSDPLFASIFAESDPTKLFANPPKNRRDFDRVLAGEGSRAVLLRLHNKVHSEQRDPAWAAGTESALRRAFVSIPRVGAQGTELRVLCGSTLCEIAGTIYTPSDTNKRELNEFNEATMSRLNPKALETQTKKLGLESTLASISGMS